MSVVTLDQRVISGQDASQFLNNRTLKAVLQRVREDLDEKALSIPATDAVACQDVIRSKQILAAFERAIHAIVNDGKRAQMHLDAMAQKSRPLDRIFRR